MIASNAGYGPIPLRWRTFGWGWVLRPQGSSGEAQLSRCARGERLIASNAGFGPIPLPPWVVGTPKSQLCAYEAELAEKENWVEVQHGVEARLVAHPDGREQERCGGPWRCG
jgi:hypothetical protein